MTGHLSKRLARTYLDVLILAELKNHPMSANEAFFFLHEKFDVWISAGTGYSCMYSLERDGLIEATLIEKNRRGRVYTLTDKGKNNIEIILKAREQIQQAMENFSHVSS